MNSTMNTLKLTALMAALTILLIWIGNLLGGRGGAQFAFLMAAVMNFGAYWFSDKIVLRMYGAAELQEPDHTGVREVVRQLARRAGLPMPRVFLIPQDGPNAFATGRDANHAAVAVTNGILRILDRQELEGVLGHELAHVRNRDILIGSIAATMAGAITILARMAGYAAMFGGSRDDEDSRGGAFGALAMMILAPLAAMLIQMAISRSREYGADRDGAAICGNPLFLARALHKLDAVARQVPLETNPVTAHMFIVNPLTGQGMLSLFSTHPPIEERIARLERMAR